jgi:hypothetical protein
MSLVCVGVSGLRGLFARFLRSHSNPDFVLQQQPYPGPNRIEKIRRTT